MRILTTLAFIIIIFCIGAAIIKRNIPALCGWIVALMWMIIGVKK